MIPQIFAAQKEKNFDIFLSLSSAQHYVIAPFILLCLVNVQKLFFQSKYLLDNSDLILHDNSATIVTGTDPVIKNLIAFFKGQFLCYLL